MAMGVFFLGFPTGALVLVLMVFFFLAFPTPVSVLMLVFVFVLMFMIMPVLMFMFMPVLMFMIMPVLVVFAMAMFFLGVAMPTMGVAMTSSAVGVGMRHPSDCTRHDCKCWLRWSLAAFFTKKQEHTGENDSSQGVEGQSARSDADEWPARLEF